MQTGKNGRGYESRGYVTTIRLCDWEDIWMRDDWTTTRGQRSYTLIFMVFLLLGRYDLDGAGSLYMGLRRCSPVAESLEVGVGLVG